MTFEDKKISEEWIINRQKDLMQLDKSGLVKAAIEELKEGRKKSIVPTGFSFIDEGPCELTGGSVFFLFGHHSAGKTSFALNIVNNVLKNNGFVMYFTNREAATDLVKLLITISAGVRLGSQVSYSDDEITKINEAGLFVEHSNLLIKEAYDGSVETIYKCCTLKTPDLIVVDGYEALFSLSRGRKPDYTNKMIRAMARMCRCPVMVLAELANGIGSDKKAEGMIMHDEDPYRFIRILSKRKKISIDEAMFIFRKDYYRLPKEHDNITSVIIPVPLSNSVVKGDLYREPEKTVYREKAAT